MCGLVGIVSYRSHAPRVSTEELVRIRDSMAPRGPDGKGLWTAPDGRIGLAHRRLSIIDLSDAGSQPMESEDCGLVIVFNGEIYNYSELRRGLQDQGIRFRSSSDTEVLLRLYERYGDAMVSHLRGMYAFAIWDSRQNRLFASRDPFGIKPLYFADDGNTLRFASQVQALRKSAAVPTEYDPAGHVGFFLFGFVPEPYSLYRSIRCLPAGHSLSLAMGGPVRIEKHFDIGEEFARASAAPGGNASDRLAEISEAMRESVRYHLVSDVPVGVFLSAGIDSACIAGLASRISPETLDAHTLGFAEYRGTGQDETIHASRIAATFGMRQSNEWVDREEFEGDLPSILHQMDQPSIDGVNTYLVSKITARSGTKVALSGLAGDELFGGYPSFADVPMSVRALGWTRSIPGIARGFRIVTAPLLRQFTSPKYASLFEYGGRFEGAYFLRRGLFMPWELPKLLDPDMVKEGWAELQPLVRLRESIKGCRNDFQRVAALELEWYMRSQLLRDADWAGMAHSLEIRVPFVDVSVFRTVARLSGNGNAPGKPELATACLGEQATALISRKKTGFSIPVETWARQIGLVEAREGRSRGWAKAIYRQHVPRSARLSKERVLVFRVGNLGDTLISLPAIGRIRERHAEANLALLANQIERPGMVNTWQVLGPTAWFDSVFHYRLRGSAFATLRESARLAMRLRQYHPTTVYNLAPRRSKWQQFRDRWFFRYVLGIPDVRETTGTPERRSMRGENLPRLEAEWHRLARVVDQSPNDQFRIPITSDHEREATRALESRGATRWARLIAIGPGSKMPAKLWPKERYAQLGKSILEMDAQCGLVIFGGMEDRAIGEYLAGQWGDRAVNFAGALSIFGAAAVLRRCQLFVGNDTGTMHLAAMSGTRCVAIFSARDFPGLWEPFGPSHVVIRKSVDCAGCMLEECVERKNMCLDMISVEVVLSAVQSALAVDVRSPAASEYEQPEIRVVTVE